VIANTKKNEILIIVGIVLLWIAVIALVNPFGDFPLDDDWAYGKPIKAFLEKGRFEFTSWASMTLIGQLLLGLLATKLFGFSFTVLRFVTLTCAAISIVYSYLILKKTSGSVPLSALFTLAIFFNPILFCLSFTFMTDVPFYCFCCLCIYYNIEYFDKGNRMRFMVGTFCSVFGVLIRQPAVILPLSFFMYALCAGRKRRRRAVMFLAQFLLTVLMLLLYDKYVKYALGYDRVFTNADMNFIKMIMSDPLLHFMRFSSVFLKTPIYFGLFTFFTIPFIIPLFKNSPALKRLFFIALISGLLLGTADLFIQESQGRQFPFAVGNIIINLGLGPVVAKHPVKGLYYLPAIYWQLLSIASVAWCTVVATSLCVYEVKTFKKTAPLTSIRNLFPVVCMALYMPVVTVISFMDRYLLLPFLLLFMVLIAVVRKRDTSMPYSRKHYLFSLIIMVPFILYSLGGTKDYLSWNRARWEGLNYLTNDLKISPMKIEGAFEFDAWYKYSNPPSPYNGTGLWWVAQDDYIVSCVPLENYSVIKTIPYQRFLPFRREEIVISKKN
jgi:hypothetical protein